MENEAKQEMAEETQPKPEEKQPEMPKKDFKLGFVSDRVLRSQMQGQKNKKERADKEYCAALDAESKKRKLK